MSKFVEALDQRFYPGVGKNWDDALFRAFILERLTPGMTVLDLGAGAGIVPQMNFKGLAGRICGVDPDPRVETNPYLDEGKVGFGERIPYPDQSFDIVFCDNVMEHLDNPDAVLREIRRVLKPGGSLMFKTPNRRHYMPAIARMTPTSFHQYVNRKRGRDAEDTFPTRYRFNRPADVRRIAAAAGLAAADLRLIERRPEYLRIHPVPYLFGIAYERLVNTTDLLAGFRILLMGRIERP